MLSADAAGAPIDPRAIDAELIHTLYQRTRPLLIANFGAAGLMVTLLWGSVPHYLLLGWAIALTGWTCLRFALARVYAQHARPIAETARWTTAFAVGSGVGGVLWGGSVAMIGDLRSDAAKLLISFVTAALSTAAVTGYSNSMAAFVAFVVPALLPYGLTLVWFDGHFNLAVAIFFGVWFFLIWSTARHLNEGYRDGVALNLRNRELFERMSRALDRADAASLEKERFLANMSHDLRTPLTNILGYAEIMAKSMLGPIGNRHYAEYVGHIHESGERLLRLVDQVVNVSRLRAGKVDLQADQIDVGELLANAARVFQSRAADERVDLRVVPPGRLPLLRGDAARVREIVLNLLSNAVKFTPPGGMITVGARVDETRQLQISIADTGIGIVADRLNLIQRPFHFHEIEDPLTRGRRADAGDSASGHGLGVPLARMLTEMHGGSLTIDSAPGAGTTVRVSFPEARLEWPETVERPVVAGLAPPA